MKNPFAHFKNDLRDIIFDCVYLSVQFDRKGNTHGMTASMQYRPNSALQVREFCDYLAGELFHTISAVSSHFFDDNCVSDDLFTGLDYVLSNAAPVSYIGIMTALYDWIDGRFHDTFQTCIVKATGIPVSKPFTQQFTQPAAAGAIATSTPLNALADVQNEVLYDIAKLAKQGLDKNPVEFCLTPAAKKLQEIQDLLTEKGYEA